MNVLGDLKPNPGNPRSITDSKLTALKKAVSKFGDLGGFVYNVKTKQLVGGHQRAKLFPKSEIQITKKFEKPTRTGTIAEGYVRIQGERFKYREVAWDSMTEKAAAIAANANAGEWNEELLGGWLSELSKSNFDLNLIMLDAEEREPFLLSDNSKEVNFEAKAAPGEDEIPAPPKRVFTVPGDIIQLGPHRLMCADSTNEKNVRKLLNGADVDLVFTDPPYLQEANGGGWIGGRKKVHVDLADEDLCSFEPEKFLNLITRLDPASFYCFGSKSLIIPYLEYFTKAGRLWDLLVMAKTNPLPSKSKHWLPDIEWLFFSRKKKSYFNDGLDFQNYFRCREITIKPREHGHPTEKQVGFIEPYLQISCPNGGVVLDLFGGSGTTMIAAEKLSRRCYMLEQSPAYCDVIVTRWEKFTGKKAKRKNGGN